MTYLQEMAPIEDAYQHASSPGEIDALERLKDAVADAEAQKYIDRSRGIGQDKIPFEEEAHPTRVTIKGGGVALRSELEDPLFVNETRR